jgi:hypothetical protein
MEANKERIATVGSRSWGVAQVGGPGLAVVARPGITKTIPHRVRARILISNMSVSFTSTKPRSP